MINIEPLVIFKYTEEAHKMMRNSNACIYNVSIFPVFKEFYSGLSCLDCRGNSTLAL